VSQAISVEAASADQLAMGLAFHDTTLAHHQYLVRALKVRRPCSGALRLLRMMLTHAAESLHEVEERVVDLDRLVAEHDRAVNVVELEAGVLLA
jgi:uncharacterized protein YigA (DUF484 family)